MVTIYPRSDEVKYVRRYRMEYVHNSVHNIVLEGNYHHIYTQVQYVPVPIHSLGLLSFLIQVRSRYTSIDIPGIINSHYIWRILFAITVN